MPVDYKKIQPELYKPKKQPSIIEVPDMKFFMIDGKGDPNVSIEYKNAIEALYATSYSLKMKIIKKENPEDVYVVPPLEGLWYKEDMSSWSVNDKSDWEWTMMIRIPDFVSEDQINRSIEIARSNKNPIALDKIRVELYREGGAAQILYIGTYADEGPVIQKLHEYIKNKGFELSGKHHEIYLNDPRKTNADKLKTIIRQPCKYANLG